MRIAYIAVKGIPMSGGIEKYTDLLAQKLTMYGHEVTVYTTKHYGNKSSKMNGYTIRAVPSLKNKNLEKITVVFSASVDQIFHKYDIVHYHALGPSIFAFMARIMRRKVVIQSHGIEYERSRWGKFGASILKLLEKLSYNMGNELTVVSKPLKRYFLKQYGKETVFIPTAVEMPQQNKASVKSLEKYNIRPGEYYLFISRLVREKGAHYLIDAFKRLKTNKKLVIAGALNQSDNYHKSLIGQAHDDDRIIFTGEVLGGDKDALFTGAYAFCLPSELEGMSIALLEAMSYRKVCIVSDIPENVDVAQGRSVLFKTKNTGSLLEALEKVELFSAEQAAEIQNLAYEYVKENHSFDSIARQIEKLYMRLLEE